MSDWIYHTLEDIPVFDKHIYYCCTIPQIISLLKDSKYLELRFVIDKEGYIHVGDSYYIWHDDIFEKIKTNIVAGYINYDDEEDIIWYSFYEDEAKNPDHPILKEDFPKYGIVHESKIDAKVLERINNKEYGNE